MKLNVFNYFNAEGFITLRNQTLFSRQNFYGTVNPGSVLKLRADSTYKELCLMISPVIDVLRSSCITCICNPFFFLLFIVFVMQEYLLGAGGYGWEF